MASPPVAALFQVTIPGHAGSVDEFGLWRTPPGATPSGAVAYDLSAGRERPGAPAGPAATEASVWHVELPTDRQQARAALLQERERLARAERALPDASRRLRAFVRDDMRRTASGEVAAFAVRPPVGALRAPPERELWARVRAATAPADDRADSFAAFGLSPGDWDDVARQAADLFDRVHQSLQHLTLVESAADGHRRGLTSVGWSGHLQTAWSSGVGPDAVEQHLISLELALRTRALWLRLAARVAGGSIELGLLFPTNPLLAVPAAWKFFSDVLVLARELEETPPRPATT